MFSLLSSDSYAVTLILAITVLVFPLIWSLQTLILTPTPSGKSLTKKKKKSRKKSPSLLVLLKIKPKKRHQRRRCCCLPGKVARKEEEEQEQESLAPEVLEEMAFSQPICAGASVGKMERKICD